VFDVAWSELMVVGAVALVVIGPKDLPKVMREVGKLVTQGRTMARSFRSGFDEMIRTSEIEDIRKQTQAQMSEIENNIHATSVQPELVEGVDAQPKTTST
jgi:sec-independent protein translocase protein TatB